MNIIPLAGFWIKHHDQITALVGSGHTSDRTSHIVIDVLVALRPLVLRYAPHLNDNALYDDFVLLIRQELIADNATVAS